MQTSRRSVITGLLIGSTGIAINPLRALQSDRKEIDVNPTQSSIAESSPSSIEREQVRWPSPFGYAMSCLKRA